MFLSLILPVYNAETYIGPCLDSLLAQDIPKEDFEILCVNDGSRDGSLSVLKQYAFQSPNVTVIDKENGGVTTARNAGLAAAKGEFVWFIDADDLVRPNCFSRLKALARQDCDRIVFGAYQFLDEMTREEWDKCQQETLTVNTPWYDAVVWRCILRRQFLLEHGLNFRYPELTHGEDGLFMYEVTLAEPRTTELDQVLYLYREHSGSAETTVTPENRMRKVRSYVRIAGILREYFRHAPNSAGANKLMSFLWMALYEIAHLPGREAGEMLGKMQKAGLYPFRRPAECTLEKSYMTDRTDLVGSVFDRIFLNLHRPWGYAAMRLLLKIKP